MLDIRLLSGVKGSGHGGPVGPLSDPGRTQGPLYLFQLPHVAQFLQPIFLEQKVKRLIV